MQRAKRNPFCRFRRAEDRPGHEIDAEKIVRASFVVVACAAPRLQICLAQSQLRAVRCQLRPTSRPLQLAAQASPACARARPAGRWFAPGATQHPLARDVPPRSNGPGRVQLAQRFGGDRA
jgi:hypothetical protein